MNRAFFIASLRLILLLSIRLIQMNIRLGYAITSICHFPDGGSDRDPFSFQGF